MCASIYYEIFFFKNYKLLCALITHVSKIQTKKRGKCTVKNFRGLFFLRNKKTWEFNGKKEVTHSHSHIHAHPHTHTSHHTPFNSHMNAASQIQIHALPDTTMVLQLPSPSP